MTDCSPLIAEAVKHGCRVFPHQSLRNYTTFRIGGECSVLIEINSEEAVASLIPLAKANGIPYFILGKGSNLLVDDRGFDGAVFHIGSDFEGIVLKEGGIISAKAGTALSKLCLFALEHRLSGLEFAWGIPGTVGGAVYMNAGAYGGEMKDILLSASHAETDGSIRSLSLPEMDLSYRHSIYMEKDYAVLSADFQLTPGNSQEIRKKMDELMERRKEKQPLEYPSAGSTFKRPEGSYAGLLIEQCGLKGKRIGDAEVSQKHSGFVVNRGSASFSDVMELIAFVQNEVYEKTGYRLECEPRIITSLAE